LIKATWGEYDECRYLAEKSSIFILKSAAVHVRVYRRYHHQSRSAERWDGIYLESIFFGGYDGEGSGIAGYGLR
jgi:hypothetical protein